MQVTRLVSLILCMAGGVAVLTASVRSISLVRVIRQESYRFTHSQLMRVAEISVLTPIGYAVASIDLSFQQVNGMDLFLVSIAFAAALFILVMVQTSWIMQQELQQRKIDIINTFVNAIEMKDPYTKGHSKHVYEIVKLFCAQIPERVVPLCDAKLLDAALLHDIGKIGVDDNILNKPGELTEEEWTAVRSHPMVGMRLLEDTCFSSIGPWVLYHHERMDGSGYMGLSGDQIPLESRVIAIADAYSALTTARSYRKAMSHAEALGLMRRDSGTHFDPQLLEWFALIPVGELVACKRIENALPKD